MPNSSFYFDLSKYRWDDFSGSALGFNYLLFEYHGNGIWKIIDLYQFSMIISSSKFNFKILPSPFFIYMDTYLFKHEI